MLPVKLYVGAKKLAAKLVLAPNQQGKRLLEERVGFAQLVWSTPICCLHGDRFLFRDDSEEFLLGGGKVIDPVAKHSRSMGVAWHENLQALAKESLTEVLTSLLLDLHKEVNLSQLCQARNIPEQLCLASLETDPINEKIKRFKNKDDLLLVAEEVFDQTVQKILDHVKAWHKLHEQEDGIPVGTLREQLKQQAESSSQAMFLAAVGELIQSGVIVLRGGLISIVGRAVALTQQQTTIWTAVQDILGKASPAIPTLWELQDATGVDFKILSHTLDFLVRKNYLFRVSERRYALASTLQSFCNTVKDMDAQSEKIEVKGFKARAGVGRNLCVEVLEYFDTIRFTQRRDSYRVVLDAQVPAKLFSKENS
jgi:selenocysteine-specific elongation factor